MAKKTVTYRHPDFGDIMITLGSRKTGIALRINREGRITVSAPKYYTTDKALEFLELKRDWLLTHIQRITAQKSANLYKLPITTRMHTIEYVPCMKLQVKIRGQIVQVGIPDGYGHQEPTVQKVIKQALCEVWRAEAQRLLPSRLNVLAQKYGFSYDKISFRNSRTRWGSCSGTNSISLSISLMSLPDPLIDYVLIHELCHTVHKNHGENFYALLDKCCNGEHKKFLKELKKYVPIV